MAPAYLEEDLSRRDSIIPGSAGHLTDACHINTTKLPTVRLRRLMKQQQIFTSMHINTNREI